MAEPTGTSVRRDPPWGSMEMWTLSSTDPVTGVVTLGGSPRRVVVIVFGLRASRSIAMGHAFPVVANGSVTLAAIVVTGYPGTPPTASRTGPPVMDGKDTRPLPDVTSSTDTAGRSPASRLAWTVAPATGVVPLVTVTVMARGLMTRKVTVVVVESALLSVAVMARSCAVPFGNTRSARLTVRVAPVPVRVSGMGTPVVPR